MNRHKQDQTLVLETKMKLDKVIILLMRKNSFKMRLIQSAHKKHGVQRRMILVDNFFVFLRLLFFALLLLYVT